MKGIYYTYMRTVSYILYVNVHVQYMYDTNRCNYKILSSLHLIEYLFMVDSRHPKHHITNSCYK